MQYKTSSLNYQQIVKNIHDFFQYHEAISLHEPQFIGKEWEYVKECLDTGWVSSVGKFVDRLENDLCQFTGAKYAIATVNGTAALHICYKLAGIKAGDEVLVPTMTFIGTITPLIYCGAIPHFIDADEKTLGINITKLTNYLSEKTEMRNNECINRDTGRTISAVVAMHTLGHPIDLDGLNEVCKQFNLILIEDAAEALGSYYKDKHVGHYGLLGALSFNGNKIVTTGGGGAILTNNAEIAKLAKHLTTTAKCPHPWLFQHDETGYNYRLPNINAALGCAQLETLQNALIAKRKLYEGYQHLFAEDNTVQLIAEPAYAKSNYWLNAIVLHEDHTNERDTLLHELHAHGIMARPLWNLQHTLPMYQHYPKSELNIAESLVKRLIKLPSSPQLLKNIKQPALKGK